MRRIYLDSCVLIYLIEGNENIKSNIQKVLSRYDYSQVQFYTSSLSKLECLVKPYRDKNFELVSYYDKIFNTLIIHQIEESIILKALELRVKYSFRTPDSIHLATSILSNADVFLTGDKLLLKCEETKVVIIND